MDQIRDELAAAWGDPEQEREVALDLFMRVGMIGGLMGRDWEPSWLFSGLTHHERGWPLTLTRSVSEGSAGLPPR